MSSNNHQESNDMYKIIDTKNKKYDLLAVTGYAEGFQDVSWDNISLLIPIKKFTYPNSDHIRDHELSQILFVE